MDKQPLISLEDICFHYPDGSQAITHLSCCIPAGSRVVLLGENGSGKSTLFQLLNGLRTPQKGCYRYNGELINYDRKQRKELLKRIGIVFQDPDVQIFAADVIQEISFGPKNLGFSDTKVKAMVQQAMEQTNICDLQEKPTHFLSYGQKKRVAIADILAMDTEVIIMDEPMAWLDMRHKKKMLEILDQLHEMGKTILVSTHDPNFAFEWADCILVMHQGTILQQGTPLEVFSNEAVMQTARLELPILFELAKTLGMYPIPRNQQELKEILKNEAQYRL